MGYGTMAYNLKKIVRSKFPLTKFPLHFVYFKIVSGSTVDPVPFHEKLRKIKNFQGDDAYCMKGSGNEILVPKIGAEDSRGNIMALQVGEGDFRYLKGLRLDEEAQELVVSMQDDETMKYQYANACKEAAIRFRPEEKWYNTAIMGFIIFCLACVILYIATTTGIGEQLSAPIKNLGSQIQQLSNSVGTLGNSVSSVSGGAASGVGITKPPV